MPAPDFRTKYVKEKLLFMKRVFAFILLIVALLAACSSPSGPEIVAPSLSELEPVVVAPAVEDEVSSGEADSQLDESVSTDLDSFSPAMAVPEAAVVRAQDHVLGSEDPIVAIVEYGDYQ